MQQPGAGIFLGAGLIIKSRFSAGCYAEKQNIPSCNENVSLCLPVCCVRVLGKTGEFEGEPRERLSSLSQAASRRATAGRVRCDEGTGVDSGAKGFIPPQKK